MKTIALAALLFLAGVACAESSTTAPSTAPATQAAEIDCQAKGDTAKISVDAEKIVLDVTLDRGIGSATLLLKKGDWPKQLIIKLNGFKSLEGFAAKGAKWTLEGNLAVGGMNEIHPTSGEAKRELKLNEKGSIRKIDGGIEITLPPILFTGAGDRIDLNWVDAYR